MKHNPTKGGTVELKKKRVMKARFNLITIETKYKEVKKLYDKALSEYRAAAIDLEEADYQQAQIDGRTKKIPRGVKQEKPLTAQQIKNVAAKLGVSLKEKNEEST